MNRAASLYQRFVSGMTPRLLAYEARRVFIEVLSFDERVCLVRAQFELGGAQRLVNLMLFRESLDHDAFLDNEARLLRESYVAVAKEHV